MCARPLFMNERFLECLEENLSNYNALILVLIRWFPTVTSTRTLETDHSVVSLLISAILVKEAAFWFPRVMMFLQGAGVWNCSSVLPLIRQDTIVIKNCLHLLIKSISICITYPSVQQTTRKATLKSPVSFYHNK